MYSCKKIVDKVSDYNAHQLKWYERFAYAVHLLMCRHCRRFVRQFELMIRMLTKIKWRHDEQLNEKIMKTLKSNEKHHQGDDHEQ